MRAILLELEFDAAEAIEDAVARRIGADRAHRFARLGAAARRDLALRKRINPLHINEQFGRQTIIRAKTPSVDACVEKAEVAVLVYELRRWRVGVSDTGERGRDGLIDGAGDGVEVAIALYLERAREAPRVRRQ